MTSRRQWAALSVATFARFAGAILMETALAVIVEARASAFAAGVVGTALVGGAATLYSYELAFAGASLIGFTAATLVAWGLVETYDPETRTVVAD
ncbi:MAG: hypothetical protein ACI8UR_002101 [Natronomonas sp.]|jgi:hypothetical protein|uniref:hypothetical protein n=1 Tax=Natronomonas sp. TaxID=2184060 RepID=UPI00398A1267